AHQHRLVGAVAAAGHGQRAVHLGAHPRDLFEHARLAQPFVHEAGGRAHRADGVRGARSYADLEQVEGADGHAAILVRWALPEPCASCCSSGTIASFATWRWGCWRRRGRRSSKVCSSTTTRTSSRATEPGSRSSATPSTNAN